MATFRVGQRVRIVGPAHSKVLGMETTVLAIGVEGASRGDAFYDGIRVASPDGGPSAFRGGIWVFRPRNLAPATDCYDKADWRECVWQPPHMRESA